MEHRSGTDTGSRRGATRVSVVIPCYNHASYLGEAIESVLGQTYADHEIVVVDDGSTDETAAVAARFPAARYVRQENQGLSAARNTGIANSTGEYLVFLDADDRLLPDALEVGVRFLAAHPEHAFVSGHFRFIAADGSPLQEWQQEEIGDDPYGAFLRRNYVAMHATVVYNRWAFAEAGRFDTTLRACEDYDLYLRLARRFPVGRHRTLVAEYRQHGANMSGNNRLMLETVREVLGRQRRYVNGNGARRRAWAEGMRFYAEYYGAGPRAAEVSARLRHGDRTAAALSALMLLVHHPGGFARRVGRRLRGGRGGLSVGHDGD